MADNKLIYQLTDGTPANSDVVPYSGPASGDAFKATVQELWAAGMQPQSNATIGTTNQVIGGPSGTAAEGYCIGNNNTLAGCAYAIGDQNQVCGTVDPCSFAYGYLEQAYAGGYSYGTNNKTVGTVSSIAGGGASFNIGRDNVVTGTNNHCDGFNCRIGYGPVSLTRTGGNNYSSGLNITQYMVGGYVVISYNTVGTTGIVRVAERVAYSNVVWNGTATTFELGALSMTPTAGPEYQMYTNDSTETFAYGYGHTLYNCRSTFIVGRGSSITNADTNVFIGYGWATNAPSPFTTYIGGAECDLALQCNWYQYNNNTEINTPASNTNSLTVDANGNIAVNDTTMKGTLFTINQTSDINVNSISAFQPRIGGSARNGQTFRLVNIGPNNITLNKDNASGNVGYRLMWQKAGNSITIAQNHSVEFIYLSNLPLSGSTGGWLVIPDGIG